MGSDQASHDHADSVASALGGGRLTTLRAMRDKLAMAMDRADHAVQAQLSAQLAKLLEQIETIEAASPEVSESERIRSDLAAGLTDANVVQLAGRRSKQSAG